MIYRRRDLPTLDPTTLSLPRSPAIAEIRTSTYQNAVGEEGLEVFVVLERLSKRQEKDPLAWMRPIERRIRSHLEEQGEERWAWVRYGLKDDPPEELDPLGGD